MTTQVNVQRVDDTYVLVPNSCKGCGRCCHLNLMLGFDTLVHDKHWRGTKCQFVFAGCGTIPVTINYPEACKYLTADHRCAIYEDRPKVCKMFVRGSKHCLYALADPHITEERDKEAP